MRQSTLGSSIGMLTQGPVQIALGTIKSRETDDLTGHRLIVDIGGRDIECLPLYLGNDSRNGVFTRYEVGASALVFVPHGSRGSAVALAGVVCEPAKPPDDFDHDRMVLVDSGGVHARKAHDEATENVVVKGFLDDLSETLGDLGTQLGLAVTAVGALNSASVGPLAGLSTGFTNLATALVQMQTDLAALQTEVDQSRATPGKPHLSHILTAGTSV